MLQASHSKDPLRTDGRFAIVCSRYNAEYTEPMLAAARSVLEAAGAASVEVVRVPGAFELPLACREAALTGRYHAVVALGCVIRGDTPHFDFVCAESARGLMQAGLESAVPVIFGVLTVDSVPQAEERADASRLDKGGEAVAAAINMAHTLAAIRKGI